MHLSGILQLGIGTVAKEDRHHAVVGVEGDGIAQGKDRGVVAAAGVAAVAGAVTHQVAGMVEDAPLIGLIAVDLDAAGFMGAVDAVLDSVHGFPPGWRQWHRVPATAPLLLTASSLRPTRGRDLDLAP